MTFEEMERGLTGMQDNMTVQGVMMHRFENNLDRLEAVVAQNSEAIARNSEAIHHLANGQVSLNSAVNSLLGFVQRLADGQTSMQAAITALSDRVDRLAEGQASMQSAMHSLFERMDRFIRGLESDGHKKRGKA